MQTRLLTLLLAGLLAPASLAQEPAAGAKPADASAAKTLVPQTVCPISGETLENKDAFVEYQGSRIYTCCKKCVAKVAAFPDYWLYRMSRDGVAAENVQTTCPVSGEKLEDDATSTQVGPLTVKTCCAKCAKKVVADPAKYLDVLQGRHAQAVCPISGEKLEGDDGFEYQGVRIRICCPKCEGKFMAEPEKHLKAMAARNEFVEQATPFCLVHPNEKIESRTWFTTVGPVRYRFARQECMTEFLKEPAKYVPALRAALPGKPEAESGAATGSQAGL